MRSTSSGSVPDQEASPQETITLDTLDRGAIEALVEGTHGAPFDVLGPHQLPAGSGTAYRYVIRAFLPGARSAWVLPESPGGPMPDAPTDTGTDTGAEAPPKPHTRAHQAERLVMRRIDAAGLFSVILPPAADATYPVYLIEAEYADGSYRRLRDPYVFGPITGELDLHLLGEGKHQRAYDVLGAHPCERDGVAGVQFAVWAPNARRVSVVGDFDGWDERALPMRARSGGVWELFIPDLPVGTVYKYAVLSYTGHHTLKADPYAFAAEVRPGTASRVWELGGYEWTDDEWLKARSEREPLTEPLTIYEIHAGSWRPDAGSNDLPRVTYRGLADQLVPYLVELGYTHVQLLPIAEYPFDGSWGYQITGYYAPTARYGTPQDFMYFVEHCHAAGIGVILDWVPGHFPKDAQGLALFDGSHLYEHEDPRRGEQPDWGTLVFNYGRNEVRNFLTANALFWMEHYHIDGLRVDAVASMLYLDYSRKAGEWLPNRYGGRENLEAIAFLREVNELTHGAFPGTITVAEESTAWPLVSRPTYVGGLGFTFKWNMGWMHDILYYFERDPIHRRYHHNALTFSLMYAFSENFILPLSHDEVVHLKGSMLTKMPGDVWQRFANLRALYGYMYGHPGKKLLFMGGEFGQWGEWNYAGWLSWFLLDPAGDRASPHLQLRTLVRDLNRVLRESPALYQVDFEPRGFEWIDCNDAEDSVVSFVRRSSDGQDVLVFVCNFTPVVRYGYRIGAPYPGRYAEVLNTDAAVYGGGNVGNLGEVISQPEPLHGRPDSIALTLPPLATLVLRALNVPPVQRPALTDWRGSATAITDSEDREAPQRATAAAPARAAGASVRRSTPDARRARPPSAARSTPARPTAAPAGAARTRRARRATRPPSTPDSGSS
ncbi:MAG TPA: 1,4-alpha-glucan branching protein GlgB [Ktedonobacterales bacterium]